MQHSKIANSNDQMKTPLYPITLEDHLNLFEKYFSKFPQNHANPKTKKKGLTILSTLHGWDSWTRTSEMQESKSCALTNLAISQ